MVGGKATAGAVWRVAEEHKCKFVSVDHRHLLTTPLHHAAGRASSTICPFYVILRKYVIRESLTHTCTRYDYL